MQSTAIPPDLWTALATLLGAAAAALVAYVKAKADKAEKPAPKSATLDDVLAELRALREDVGVHGRHLEILLDRTPR